MQSSQYQRNFEAFLSILGERMNDEKEEQIFDLSNMLGVKKGLDRGIHLHVQVKFDFEFTKETIYISQQSKKVYQ